MTIFQVFALALALVVAPLPAIAQQATPPAQQEREERTIGPRGPFLGGLLALRGELGLTDQQVESLHEIANRLQAQNAPLIERLRAAGIPAHPMRRDHDRMTPEQRREFRAALEANRPTIERLRQNTKAAMQEAHGVLTPPQRERMRTLVEQQRDRTREQRPHQKRDGDRSRRSGARPGT